MNSDSPRAAIHAVPVSEELQSAATAAAASFDLAKPRDRFDSFKAGSCDFALAFGKAAAEQLTPAAKLQILLIAAAARMFNRFEKEPVTLEQFVEFVTGHDGHCLTELEEALDQAMLAMGSDATREVVLQGFETSDLKPS